MILYDILQIQLKCNLTINHSQEKMCVMSLNHLIKLTSNTEGIESIMVLQ